MNQSSLLCFVKVFLEKNVTKNNANKIYVRKNSEKLAVISKLKAGK